MWPSMVAGNYLRGDLPLANWSELEKTTALLVDVRSEMEFTGGHISNAENLPLETLRDPAIAAKRPASKSAFRRDADLPSPDDGP